MADFYITLPSDACDEILPDNRLHTFHTILPHQFLLTGDWTVGLTEIQYPPIEEPLPWDKEKNALVIDLFERLDPLAINAVPPHFTKFTRKVKHLKFSFETLDDLSKQINEQKLKLDHGILKTLHNQNKFTLEFNHRKPYKHDLKMVVQIKGEQAQALFGASTKTDSNERFMDEPRNLKIDFNIQQAISPKQRSMYIYSSLITEQIIGNILSPLLRVIDIQPSNGRTILRFDNPYYIPIKNGHITEISTYLRDNVGGVIKFPEISNNGPVILIFHFKQRHL